MKSHFTWSARYKNITQCFYHIFSAKIEKKNGAAFFEVIEAAWRRLMGQKYPFLRLFIIALIWVKSKFGFKIPVFLVKYLHTINIYVEYLQM